MTARIRITLKGGNAYAALKELLLRGLGLAQLGAVDKTAANAHEAIDNTISYVFTLLDEICETPFKAILSVVGNLSFFIANGDLDIALKNMLAPVLGILDVVEGVIPRAQLDGLLKGFIGVSLTEILDIGQNDGANIVKLVNGLLGKIEIKDENGETIFVLNALKNDFFKTIAKAAIRIDELKNPLLGQNVKQWHVETGSTLLAVLNSVLTNEFLTVLCGTIGIDKSSDIGQILISLAGKGEELVGVLLKFLAKYLVKYNTFTQPNLEKIDIAYSSDTTHAQLNAALGQLDALVPTILTMIGDGTAEKLSDLIYPLILTDDIANTLVSTIVSLAFGTSVRNN